MHTSGEKLHLTAGRPSPVEETQADDRLHYFFICRQLFLFLSQNRLVYNTHRSILLPFSY